MHIPIVLLNHAVALYYDENDVEYRFRGTRNQFKL